jgi:diguanylate cyclase (GGDEF)-like protein
MTGYRRDTAAREDISRMDRLAALGAALALAAVAVLATRHATLPLTVVPGFLAGFAGATLMTDLVLCILLFSKGAITGEARAVRLAAAYLFSALMIPPHVACFPGALMPQPVIGTSGGAVWLWALWHGGFALFIAHHALLARTRLPTLPIAGAIGGVVLLVGALVALGLAGYSHLPDVVQGDQYFGGLGLVPATVFALNVLALGLVLGLLRARSAEDLWLAVAMLAACVDVWLTYAGGSRYTLGWYVGRAATLTTGIVVLISIFRDITLLYRNVARANHELARLAEIDGLTGINNRRHLDRISGVEWRRAQRERRAISLLLVDVDHFKAFNDLYGHVEGDECLRQVAGLIARAARRPSDFAARYGGEEFALLLPATDAEGARRVADGLREAVQAAAIAHGGSKFGVVTVSIGVASAMPDGRAVEGDLLAEADRALYGAKRFGRNGVAVAGDEIEAPPTLARLAPLPQPAH